MSKISFIPPRAPGQYDPRKVSDETALLCEDPTLTQQQFLRDGDVNFIMEKFLRTNDMSLFTQASVNYGDFTGTNDLHTSLNIVIAAQEAFDLLPARVRNRFDNDMLKFSDFMDDRKNFDEAMELGLLRPDAKSMKDAPRPLDELSPAGEAAPASEAKPAGGNSSPPKAARPVTT